MKRKHIAPIVPIIAFVFLVAFVSCISMACGMAVNPPQADETAVPSAPIKLNSVFVSEPLDQPETVVVTAETLYVRSCASTACNVLTSVTRGTHLRLVADGVKSDDSRCSLWAEIEVAGVGGFVCREFVK